MCITALIATGFLYITCYLFEVTLQLTVSQSVYLDIEHPRGTCDQILPPVEMLLPEICGLLSVGRPLRREDGSAICSVITQWSELLRTRNFTLLSHLRLPCYLLQLLLDFGAQIECTCMTSQWTHPLHLATTYKYLSCFILLLEGGADITLAGHILHLICTRKYELLNRLLGNVTTLYQMQRLVNIMNRIMCD
jgi:hypothetical protein